MQVVTDDMPFLVDSLTMELARQDRDVRLVIHPQMDVVRDITGEIKSVTGVEDGSVAAPRATVRESWMQVEISRVTARRRWRRWRRRCNGGGRRRGRLASDLADLLDSICSAIVRRMTRDVDEHSAAGPLRWPPRPRCG